MRKIIFDFEKIKADILSDFDKGEFPDICRTCKIDEGLKRKSNPQSSSVLEKVNKTSKYRKLIG